MTDQSPESRAAERLDKLWTALIVRNFNSSMITNILNAATPVVMQHELNAETESN